MVSRPSVGRWRVDFSPSVWLSIKVFALVMMVIDHVDWGLYGGALVFHDTWGRAVFPLFALVLGRSVTLGDAMHLVRAVVPRMLAVGAVASVFYVPVFGPYPLNVMFTLAAGVACCAGWRLGYRALPVWCFVLAGFVVDYNWFGLACIVLAAWSMSRPVMPVAAVLAVMTVVLWPINGNAWALLSVPLWSLATLNEGRAPRLRWLFYAAYPVHLAVLSIAAFYL